MGPNADRVSSRMAGSSMKHVRRFHEEGTGGARIKISPGLERIRRMLRAWEGEVPRTALRAMSPHAFLVGDTVRLLPAGVCGMRRWEHRLPVVLHAHDDPALRHRLVPTLVEMLELVCPVVRKLPFRVVVMNEEGETCTITSN